MISDLGRIASGEGDEKLLGACVTFIQSTNELMGCWNAENFNAFTTFSAGEAEVDELEALLALVGEEVNGGNEDA